MSVALIISPGIELEPFLVWGKSFAEARGLELDVVFLSNAKAEAPEGVGRSLGSSDLFHAVLSDVAEKKPELVLLARQSRDREDATAVKLVRRLFAALPCDTVMLRASGLPDGEDGHLRKVLVPISGGPHSQTALGWARDLVMRDGEGKVTPLFVEPDTGEYATEVGEKRLARMLKRAGMSPDAPAMEPRVVLEDDVRKGIAKVAAEGEHQLLLIGAPGVGALRSLLFGTIPERLFSGEEAVAVAVLRRSASLAERVRRRIERWLHLRIPQLERAERITLFENIETNARWSFDFMLLISLSTAIAGVGLMINSTAVVIGAMLVAPLMTPLLGSGLALVQGNLPMMRSAARAIVYGFLAALLIGVVLGWCSVTPQLTPEMEARGGPGLPDMVIALLSGVAASYCIARPNLSSALAGVAIAAALVPPIATVGIAIALGEFGVARGAALLFATNVVAIILGAAATFYATGVRGSRATDRDSGEVRRPVWVRRTILILLLCAMGLVVPLGSALISRVAERVVDDPQERSFYRVEEEVFKALADEVAGWGEGYRLDDIKAYRTGDDRTLELDVVSKSIPDEARVNLLAKKASQLSGEPTRVRVLTRLVVESAP